MPSTAMKQHFVVCSNIVSMFTTKICSDCHFTNIVSFVEGISGDVHYFVVTMYCAIFLLALCNLIHFPVLHRVVIVLSRVLDRVVHGVHVSQGYTTLEWDLPLQSPQSTSLSQNYRPLPQRSHQYI